eukprot:TRINITY_DN17375_c0_g2_i1.p2 TRINITY_DN17375_c0_g2~~TRINITY_DN17375_c0_g2_i1.p2  ORF type:complete len:366 (-),score=25.61 TRINITY_DN17375_c0_g2_i1:217-1314(-)
MCEWFEIEQRQLSTNFVRVKFFGGFDMKECKQRGNSNITINLSLLFVAPVPSIVYFVALQNKCSQFSETSGDYDYNGLLSWNWETWCRVGLQHPIFMINILFFLNVCIGFWIVSLLQNSTWLIDPYWTILPPLIGLFFQLHPLASGNVFRVWTSTLLLWVWAIRLTHSYFRREEWQVGEREDWRYSKLRAEYGIHWTYVSFFAVYFVQQIMLVGITLPFWAVSFFPVEINMLDYVATITCVSGLIIAWISDNQLRQFMMMNQKLRQKGQPQQLLLNTGLWKYSRHPNYFGEQLWWWGIAFFGVSTGQTWTIVGTLFNSAVMIGVTQLTEARMTEREDRRELYRQYQRATSVWIPWFTRKQSPKQN